MGLELPTEFQARQINPENDIVQFDIVLVMDKFTAADVLREVPLFCYVGNASGDSTTAPCRLLEAAPVLQNQMCL